MTREKIFDDVEDAGALLASYRDVTEWIADVPPLAACRDPKDDKFLALAVHGGASLLITGDQDLLMLHPFAGMALLTPRAFLGDGDGVTGCGGIKKSPTPCPAKL